MSCHSVVMVTVSTLRGVERQVNKGDNMIKLSIPQVPESYNKISTWHWAEKREYNKLWYDEIKYSWKNFWTAHLKSYSDSGDPSMAYYVYDMPFEKAKIDFYIYFPFKHRRDKLNYALGLKPALDQIANEDIIVDDNWDRIDDNYYSRIDKNNPRTEITIEEIK